MSIRLTPRRKASDGSIEEKFSRCGPRAAKLRPVLTMRPLRANASSRPAGSAPRSSPAMCDGEKLEWESTCASFPASSTAVASDPRGSVGRAPAA
jgi:hypothetical protein